MAAACSSRRSSESATGIFEAFELLQHVFNVVGRNDIVRQLTIQIVESQKFLVAAQLEQAIHHIISIFFFNSHVYLFPSFDHSLLQVGY